MIELGALFLVGLVAGWLNVMAGGGSLLTVPVLLFLGLPGPVANGTNRIGILLQNVTAVLTFFRKGVHDFHLGLTLALMASLGALVGASVGVRIDGEWFDRILAGVIIGVMVLMMLPSRGITAEKRVESVRSHVSLKRIITGHMLMLVVGFWGGMIQMGVGFILIPVLHHTLRLDLVRVNMYKVLIILVYTVVALVVFGLKVDISWRVGLALAIGMMIGGWIGVHTSILRGDRWIRIVMYVVLSVVCVRLLFF